MDDEDKWPGWLTLLTWTVGALASWWLVYNLARLVLGAFAAGAE